MLAAAELVRMMKIADDLVKEGRLNEEVLQACLTQCRDERLTALETANRIAQLIYPPDPANDDHPERHCA